MLSPFTPAQFLTVAIQKMKVMLKQAICVVMCVQKVVSVAGVIANDAFSFISHEYIMFLTSFSIHLQSSLVFYLCRLMCFLL